MRAMPGCTKSRRSAAAVAMGSPRDRRMVLTTPLSLSRFEGDTASDHFHVHGTSNLSGTADIGGDRIQRFRLGFLASSGLVGEATTVDLLPIDAHRLGGGDAEANLVAVNGNN